MPAEATTIRLDPDLKAGLVQLCRLRSITLNKMIAAALRQHIASDVLLLQQEFDASIKDLQRVAAQDPDFEQAIGRVVGAEVSTSDDPAEGAVVPFRDRATTALVRDLLNG